MESPPSALIAAFSLTGHLPLESLYPARQPLEVDIGCGKGRFLVHRASTNPGINYLGIEKKGKRIRKVDRKICRAGLTNARIIAAEASLVLSHLIPDNSVTTHYMFFPDPWPKRRHHRRRLFCREFLEAMHRTLIKGGQVNIATDNMDYFAAIRKVFVEDPRFVEVEPFVTAPEERTEFETIFLAMEAKIGRGSFRKV